VQFYTCLPRSRRYDIVDRTVVVAALHYALIAAYFEGLADASGDLREMVAEPLAWLRNTPAYGKTGYESIGIKDCVRFDMAGADISPHEMQVYAELLAMNDRSRFCGGHG
jgi:hypothetical protein